MLYRSALAKLEVETCVRRYLCMVRLLLRDAFAITHGALACGHVLNGATQYKKVMLGPN